MFLQNFVFYNVSTSSVSFSNPTILKDFAETATKDTLTYNVNTAYIAATQMNVLECSSVYKILVFWRNALKFV